MEPPKLLTEILPPLPYPRKLLEYLKAREPGLWEWFSSAKFRADYASHVQLELLKSAYRLEREAHRDLYAVADRALAALHLTVPVTIYQSQVAQGLNAALAYVPGEAHVLFTGPVVARLSVDELFSVLSHELSHYVLLDGFNGDFLTADQILTAMANHDRARPCHFQSARLFRLYTELFADRGALFATGNPMAGISGLVKLETGLETVDAESYLRQADEIFSREQVKTEELTHPETFIRARALKLWVDRGEEAHAEIARMIEGPLALDGLDLVGQARVSDLTRRLLSVLLAPAWFRSPAVLSHARLFFEDFAPPAAGHDDAPLFEELRTAGLQDYFCALLLDFAAVDPDLEEAPLAAGLALSERMGCAERFEELVAKDLGVAKKKLAQVKKERDKILAKP